MWLLVGMLNETMKDQPFTTALDPKFENSKWADWHNLVTSEKEQLSIQQTVSSLLEASSIFSSKIKPSLMSTWKVEHGHWDLWVLNQAERGIL